MDRVMMMLHATLVVALVVGCASAPPKAANDPRSTADNVAPALTPQETSARSFIDDLARHDWAAATQRFNREMAEAESPARLETTWTRTETKAGAFEAVEKSRLEADPRTRTAVLTVRFAQHRRTLRVVFDGEQRIAGFWIRPVAEDLQRHARGVIEALVRGDMTAAAKDFDENLRERVPPAKLEESWNAILANIGEFVELENLRVTEERNVSVALATCKFARGKVLVKIAYRDDAVAAIYLLPAEG
jgi:hypothetical protein